jgi:hypothetical protein
MLVVKEMSYPHESFSQMFERWSHSEEQRRSQLTEQLKVDCRSTWETGETGELLYVLEFIRLSGDTDRFDIVLKGIELDEEDVATHAVMTASYLMMRGFNLGPTTRMLLERFGSRFPAKTSSVVAAMAFLNKLETNWPEGSN